MGRSSLDAMNAWWICAVRAKRDARLPARRALCEGAAFLAGVVLLAGADFAGAFFFVFEVKEPADWGEELAPVWALAWTLIRPLACTLVGATASKPASTADRVRANRE
jgi:hypothetical protein